MASRQEQFAREIDALLKESQNVSRETAQRVLRMLEDARRDIVARLAAARPESFTAAQLNALLEEVDRQMREFARRAGTEMAQAGERQWRLGAELAERPVIQVGGPGLLAGLDATRLVIAQGYAAELVSGLSREAATRLNLELRRAMLGGQPIGDIVGRITKLLDGAASRAETIAFTEINRMQSIATQARLEQMAARMKDRPGGPAIRKQWRHNAIGIPRQGHVRIDGIVQDVDKPFFIPEYFPATGGGRPVPAEWLMYPRDPAGSPANTINCHCSVVPYVEVPERGAVPRHGRLEVFAA